MEIKPSSNDTKTRDQAQVQLLRNQARLEIKKVACDLTKNNDFGCAYFNLVDLFKGPNTRRPELPMFLDASG